MGENNGNFDLEKEKMELERQKIELEKMKIQHQMNNIQNYSGTSTGTQGFSSPSNINTIEKLNKIKKTTIKSLIFFVIGFIFLMIGIMLMRSGPIGMVFLAIGLLIFLPGPIIMIIIGVKIITTDFGNKEINDSKLLWGLLTIFLLGFIAAFIFIFTSKNKINEAANIAAN